MPLIEADALKRDVRRYALEGTDDFGDIPAAVAERSFLSLIDRQPVVEAELVRHGHWEKKENIMYNGTLNENVCWISFVCSECRGEVVLQYPGCPFCRAKMDGGADNV